MVCQRSFFTLVVYRTAPASFFCRHRNLPVGPGLQGFLADPADLFDPALLGRIGKLQIATGIFNDRKQGGNSLFDLRVGIQPAQ